MAPYEDLYSRKCRSLAGWFEVGEASLFGPDLVHQAIEKVAYELRLPSELQAVHPVFHMSMLRKCIGDPSKIIPVDDIQVTENLTYEEEPIAILDRQVRRLRNKEMASIKVLWRSKDREEMTWEAETEMKSKYTHLFHPQMILFRRNLYKMLLYPQITYKVKVIFSPLRIIVMGNIILITAYLYVVEYGRHINGKL
ncbi:uncharacterized protein LOC132039363 [Lycium ferocissimum]|uniref:uncharacterized protein LOC132039363 n=1 Tax=Lycium ferocissimum TaxID=112874 RepID=UPI002814B4CE|nr:uncharacterized protein LOC132039363 [Lycium ferocissimum]